MIKTLLLILTYYLKVSILFLILFMCGYFELEYKDDRKFSHKQLTYVKILMSLLWPISIYKLLKGVFKKDEDIK